MRKLLVTSLLLAAAAALAVAATATGAASPTAAAKAAIPGCAVDSLDLVEDGILTIGADNPAFPPWFGGAEKTKPWKVSDPYSGKGYESAVAYAVASAARLPEVQGQVDGRAVQQLVPPGQEAVRLLPDQVSFTPERAQAVDFSNSYYFVNQSVVGRKGQPIAKVKSIAGLKPFKLGAQVGTTTYNYIKRFIRPSSKPLVYDTNDAAVQALKNGQIDGIVVDLPTAFYVTAVQVDDGVIVGKLPDEGHEGALRAWSPEGQHAPALRQPGDQPAVGERDDQEAADDVSGEAPARPT